MKEQNSNNTEKHIDNVDNSLTDIAIRNFQGAKKDHPLTARANITKKNTNTEKL